MLTVDHYELIRRKVEIDGETQRDVAKELGHSRKTVTKALKLRIPPGYQLTKPRPRPVAVHRRCYIPGQFILDPMHYLKLLQRKPGSLDNA